MYELLEINGEMVLHTIVPIHPDGNCLFGTLSYLMYKTQNRSEEIRKLIVRHVVSKWDHFQNLSHDTYGDTFSCKLQYSAEMSRNGTYGTLCELKAAGEIFEYLFEVYIDCKMYVRSGIENHSVRRLRFTGELSNGHFEAYEIQEKSNNSSLQDQERVQDPSLVSQSFEL